MTNKMKSVGEALQGFLETAVPSPLSAEERERLRLYNPTLAAQIDALVIRLPRLRSGNGPRL